MEKRIWSIDECRYEDYKNQSLILRGWYAGPSEEEYRFVLLGDGREILEPVPKERFARPDVQAQYPEILREALPGFTLEVEGIWALAGEYRVFELVLDDGEDCFCIWKKTAEELLAFCKSCLVEFHMDREEIIYKTMLVTEGWMLSQRGEAVLLAEDSSGNPLPAAITRQRRPDVVQKRGLPEEFSRKELGFSVSVKLEDIKGGMVRLRFLGKDGEKSHVIDVKKRIAENTPWARRKKVLSWENRKANLAYLREHGVREFVRNVDVQAGLLTGDYEMWVRNHRASRAELHRQRKSVFPYMPLISIVIPLYNTPLPFLKEVVDSIRAQSYRKWQLCLADGSEGNEIQNYLNRKYGRENRIYYKKLKENKGISQNTNEAIALATGDYIMLCDHDDVVAPNALFEIVMAINQNRRTDVLYTDEDKVSMDGRHYFEPNFKPDFNLFRLRENNYICHIFVVKRKLLEHVGYFRPEFDGAQDFDLILRCCEKAKRIVHIPKVLYHWRSHLSSTALDPASKAYAFEAGRRAVSEHYRRLGIKAEVERTCRPGWYRSHVDIPQKPLVSIIIPNKDHVEDLRLCLSSIREKSTYQNYEILIVENNSRNPETFAFYESLKEEPRVRVLTWKDEFNYSAINNFGVKEAKGSYLLFLNNDVEIITPSWMEEMLMVCRQPSVGMAGAKLYYPDDTVQHAGVVLGLGGIAGHIMCRAKREDAGYMGRMVSVQEISAVTAACMLIKKEVFCQAQGFDEELKVAFNDTDLCMKVRALGQKIVFTPYAELYHYESKSRGLEDTPEKQQRFARETAYFRKKWFRELEKGDPYYSPSLSVTEGDCSLREDGGNHGKRSD